MAEHTHHTTPIPTNGHERTDANPGGLLRLGIILLGLLVGVLGLMFGLWKVFQQNPPEATTQVSSFAEPEMPPTEPRLQPQPATDMTLFRRWEDSVLTTYGWVDQEKGIVRIPIDSAIAMVLRKGFAVQGNAADSTGRQ